MADASLWQSIVLGLVEGITEFIPVSSTGHLILVGHLIGFEGDAAKVFEVVIQLGAILAVCILYFGRLWKAVVELPTNPAARHFALTVLVAFLPSVILGLVLHDFIKSVLFSPWVVVWSMILGGIAILVIERVHPRFRHEDSQALPTGTALGIGLFQVISMIPGVSRSGATIMGALLLGVDRKAAAEFSFFLAIPTMLGASALDLYKARDLLQASDLVSIAVGFVVALVSAFVVVRAFVGFIQRHTFDVFGWYRIAAGVVMAAVLWAFA
ncbi:MAG: undecaprenyl-diphosphate phosphatase [Geminicoccaceae bacterium]